MSRKDVQLQYDVGPDHFADEVIGGHIAQHLALKGFCLLAPGLVDADGLAAAAQQAKDLEFYQINAAVADGLLGAEGSARVADLDSGLEDEARREGPSLVALDQQLSRLWAGLCPYMEYLGVEMTMRSDAVVHRAGAAEEETVDLTERQVTHWQAQFLRHTVMLVAFLGPKPGVLQLQPYAEDAEPVQMRTLPGAVVALRADTMMHRHSSSGESLAMSCFLMAGACRRGLPVGLGLRPMVPAAAALEEWTVARLQELKDREQHEELRWSSGIPRSWQAAMNHTFHRGQITGIGGDACALPCSRDPETTFLSGAGGVDYATEVPSARWQHDDFWDAAADSYSWSKTSCRHGSFAEGVELFDNKFFNLSVFEAKSLDPHSRMLLEVGYEAFARMGYKKKSLMNAAGGVYVGCQNVEWAYAGSAAPVEGRGSAGMLCFHSGRISFCLGLKGPAISITTEASSGLSAVVMAAESVQRKGTAVGTDFAIGLGSHLLLSPVWWSNESMAGRLSRQGRCLTFDATADGYIRGDATCAVAVKNASDIVDGEIVKAADADSFLATIAGGKMSSSGQCASLTAPNSAAEQQVVADAVRNASLSHDDVDGVEVHGDATFMSDAIEVSAVWRAHRHQSSTERLQIGAVKSSFGNQVEASGITSLLKVVHAARWGHQVPNLHMRQVNPHLGCFENPLDLLDEGLEFPFRSTFNGVKSRGLGGSNAYLIAWGTLSSDEEPGPERAALPLQSCPAPTFWPGGGGELEDDQRPRKRDGYFIAGTWSRWREPQKMEAKGKGVYTFNVVLGENRWEKFQIWLDGDERRALYPRELNASKGSAVLGPDRVADGVAEEGWWPSASSGDPGAPAWLVDGRPWEGNAEAGLPGEAYAVRFEVVGRWRLVTWEKLVAIAASHPVAPASAAAYYFAASWNDWELDEMSADRDQPGLFYIVVRLPSIADAGFQLEQTAQFQIVRNADWSQAFYPLKPTGDGSGAPEVCGPDDDGGETCWLLSGRAEERFRIEFRRSLQGGADVRSVSWRRLGDAT